MIFIVDIEAVETRYTAQWKKYLPRQLGRHTNQSVMTISGGNTPQATTPGAFLNFGGTNDQTQLVTSLVKYEADDSTSLCHKKSEINISGLPCKNYEEIILFLDG